MFRLSWAITLIFSLGMLTGILVVTRDLAETNAIFKDGVVQAEKVNSTTDTALGATGQLPPADKAIGQGLPQVVDVLGSLSKAQTTLGTLGNQLGNLGTVLTRADPPLVGIIGAAQQSTNQANAAAAPAASIVRLLAQADQRVQALAPLLDQTAARARNINSKLHVLMLLPGSGGG
ncbi:hypothetical protein NGB36_00370 [Streptomyces sp. RB6PN25]|uniref:Uncharacterized protein n=1 Tax=Streptomyces humicola TaxID=2953240 RepID=A0ABT1PN70_9ACTN|nr:hypothetical protein [Streptomyces humicola]MCQ4079109.1 hypothetical protein [Streptomyces humicola]